MDVFFELPTVLLPALLHIAGGHLDAPDFLPQAPPFLGNVPQWVGVYVSCLALRASSQPQK